MDELDPQMEQLKQAYEATRYPGDLARDLDLVAPSRRPWGWWMAIAASVALVTGLTIWAFTGNGGGRTVVKQDPDNTGTGSQVSPEVVASGADASDESLVASMQNMTAPTWPTAETGNAQTLSAPADNGFQGVSWSAVSAPTFPTAAEAAEENNTSNTQTDLSL